MSHSQRILLHLCLLLIPYILHSRSISRIEVDSLLRLLAQSRPDTNRVKVLLRLGEYQLYKPGEFKADLVSSPTYAGQARALSDKLGEYRLEAKSLNLLSFVNLESKDFHLDNVFQQAATNLFCPPQ